MWSTEQPVERPDSRRVYYLSRGGRRTAKHSLNPGWKRERKRRENIVYFNSRKFHFSMKTSGERSKRNLGWKLWKPKPPASIEYRVGNKVAPFVKEKRKQNPKHVNQRTHENMRPVRPVRNVLKSSFSPPRLKDKQRSWKQKEQTTPNKIRRFPESPPEKRHCSDERNKIRTQLPSFKSHCFSYFYHTWFFDNCKWKTTFFFKFFSAHTCMKPV